MDIENMSDEELSTIQEEVENENLRCPECESVCKEVDKGFWYCTFCDDYFNKEVLIKNE